MTAGLSFINDVEDALANGTVDRRGELLRRVTDLFVVGSEQYTYEQIELFDQVFTRLAAQIEISARALLAIRLAPLPNAPPNAIRTLAFDDAIDVAGPVLAQSERLDDAMLVETARQKGQDHLLAISRRRSLSEEVTDVLVARGDRQVVLSTVENRGAKFSDGGFAILVRRSDGDDALAGSVGTRPEIPPQLYLKLLAKASQSVRQKLEAAHPQAREAVRQVVAEVENRMRGDAFEDAADLIGAQEFADTLRRSGRLDDSQVEVLAQSGRIEETAAALALMCEVPLAFVKQAMKLERPETLLILARASGLSWSTVKTVLSLCAKQRLISAGEMAQCLASFERLKPTTAREIVRFYRTRDGIGQG